MRFFLNLSTILIFLFIPSLSQARIFGVEFDSYATLATKLRPSLDRATQAQSPIFVFLDIDNTQVTYQPAALQQRSPIPIPTIGSETWFDWQLSLAESHPQRIYKTVREFIYQNYFAGKHSSVRPILTDLSLPTFIRSLKIKYRATVHSLTARSRYYSDSTEAEFKHLGIQPSPLLVAPYHRTLQDVTAKNNTRHIYGMSYGVILLSGTHKGNALVEYLKMVRAPQNALILFIDNKKHHIQAVADAIDQAHFDGIVARYTGLDSTLNEFMPADGKPASDRAEFNKKAMSTAWNNMRTDYISSVKNSPIINGDLFWTPKIDSSYF